MGMEALRPEWARRASDAELQRGAFVAADLSGGELTPELALLVGRSFDARPQRAIGRSERAPALDAARGLEP